MIVEIRAADPFVAQAMLAELHVRLARRGLSTVAGANPATLEVAGREGEAAPLIVQIGIDVEAGDITALLLLLEGRGVIPPSSDDDERLLAERLTDLGYL